MFENLNPIPIDYNLDPPPYACFNCWKRTGHNRENCDLPKIICCHNCGRYGVYMEDCPRCKDEYIIYLENSPKARRLAALRRGERPIQRVQPPIPQAPVVPIPTYAVAAVQTDPPDQDVLQPQARNHAEMGPHLSRAVHDANALACSLQHVPANYLDSIMGFLQNRVLDLQTGRGIFRPYVPPVNYLNARNPPSSQNQGSYNQAAGFHNPRTSALQPNHMFFPY